MTEFLNRIMQQIHRVKATPALEWPAPLLIRLDQRHENLELIALWRAPGRAERLLGLGERGGPCRCGSGGFAWWSLSRLRNGQSINGIVFSVRSNILRGRDLAEVEVAMKPAGVTAASYPH
jgi:hypothetical protein